MYIFGKLLILKVDPNRVIFENFNFPKKSCKLSGDYRFMIFTFR
jgi:hypothetical protein